MPKALVLYPAGHGPIEQVARAIYGGASETGLETTLLSTEHPVDVSGYDLVFLGSGVYGLGKFDSKIMAVVHAGHWAGKRACVFSTHSGRGKAHVEAVGNELGKKNAKLAGTIAIQLHGHRTIGINVTDKFFVSNVSFNITFPNASVSAQFYLGNDTQFNRFNISYLILSTDSAGTYNISFFANDTAGNSIKSVNAPSSCKPLPIVFLHTCS